MLENVRSFIAIYPASVWRQRVDEGPWITRHYPIC